MKSELRLIDQISMKFEDVWETSLNIDQIFSFIQQESLPELRAATLCAEIFLIDIGRRWQTWGDRNFSDKSIDQIKQELHDQKRAARYLAEASRLGIELSDAQITEIHEQDFIFRTRFGDAPYSRSDRETQSLDKIANSRPRITVYSNGRSEVKGKHFCSPILVGRQAIGEPPPFTWVEKNDHQKLVCADGRQPLVSRQQMRIEILNTQFAIIENLSANRYFPIIDGQTVAPQSRSLAKIPFQINLEVIMVSVARS